MSISAEYLRILLEVDYELGYFVCPSCRESICFIDGHAEEHECCLKCGQRLDFGGLNEI